MNHVAAVMQWVGTVTSAGWLISVPAFLYSHRSQLKKMAGTSEELLKEVQDLNSQFHQDVTTTK